MPRLTEDVIKKGHVADKKYQHVPRVMRSKDELAAGSLYLLWSRLLKSYRQFSLTETTSFISDAPNLNRALSSHVANDEWGSGFAPKSNLESFIFHLYAHNRVFDTHAWLIAFCMIDKLHLQHYVRKSIHKIIFWKTENPSTLLQIDPNYMWQFLFSMYSLAFKWHVDYRVSIRYLVNTLPHHEVLREHILKSALLFEVNILRCLGYNCYIDFTQIVQLVHHFLTSSERRYIDFY